MNKKNEMLFKHLCLLRKFHYNIKYYLNKILTKGKKLHPSKTQDLKQNRSFTGLFGSVV